MGKSDMMGSFHGNYRYSLLIQHKGIILIQNSASVQVSRSVYIYIHLVIQNLYLGSYIDSIIYSNNKKRQSLSISKAKAESEIKIIVVNWKLVL